MEEILRNEKIISYDNFSQISEIITLNLEKHFLLVRHNSSEKKLFFKKLKEPSIHW